MDRLQEIRDRAEKAIEGPWVPKRFGGSEVSIYKGPIKVEGCGMSHHGEVCKMDNHECSDFKLSQLRDTAKFIAHARQDVPYLLDALEKAQGELARLAVDVVSVGADLRQAQTERDDARKCYSQMNERNKKLKEELLQASKAFSEQVDREDCLSAQLQQSADRERVLREILTELVGQCENAPHQGPCEGPFAWSLNIARQALKQEDTNGN